MLGKEIQERLGRCKTLPTLPAIATEILELCGSDEASLEQLSDVLSKDVALSAKVLSVANSAAYATRGGAPTTVTQAVLRLGLNHVMTLALSLSLAKIERPHDGFDYAQFWRRALFSGTAARAAARVVQCDAEEAFLAGMFQDLGMLALHQALGSAYGSVIKESEGDHLRLERLEREAFDTDHREVGAWLAARWKLPEYLVHTTRSSHKPDAADTAHAYDAHTRAVAVGGFMAEIWRPAADHAAATRQAAECARRWLGIDSGHFTLLVIEISKELPTLSKLFEVGIDQAQSEAAVARARETLTSQQRPHPAPPARGSAQEARDPAEKDPLTRLFGLAHFERELDLSFQSAQEAGRPLSVLVCDVDRLGEVNARHGNHVGDSVLQSVGRLLLRCVRQLDIPVRLDGAEFAVILPGTDTAGARLAAERLRRLLERMDIPIGAGRAITVTASFGCASAGVGFQPHEPSRLFAAAQESLGAAKAEGRNRVVVYRRAS